MGVSDTYFGCIGTWIGWYRGQTLVLDWGAGLPRE